LTTSITSHVTVENTISGIISTATGSQISEQARRLIMCQSIPHWNLKRIRSISLNKMEMMKRSWWKKKSVKKPWDHLAKEHHRSITDSKPYLKIDASKEIVRFSSTKTCDEVVFYSSHQKFQGCGAECGQLPVVPKNQTKYGLFESSSK
jgi:hypothetical protein